MLFLSYSIGNMTRGVKVGFNLQLYVLVKLGVTWLVRVNWTFLPNTVC